MFQDDVQKRLDLLVVGTNQPVQISDKLFHLTEKGQGKADLTVSLLAPCILFCDLERKKLQYFKNKHCADYVIFEFVTSGWRIHIFELKRSVGVDEWKTIKNQFAGALQNALALAGVLGIQTDISEVALYTVYRNDKLNDAANPGKLHYQMHMNGSQAKTSDCQDWNEKRIVLDFTEDISAEHHKIKLDIENGTGECELATALE